jgi:ankyrin repeat protein
LLDQGAKAWSRYLFTAMKNGHPEMVKLLVDARVEVNETGRVLSETPLHRAARLNDIESTRILLEAGADPNLKDYMGNTVLGFSKSDELNALLRSYGAKTSRGFRGERDD